MPIPYVYYLTFNSLNILFYFIYIHYGYLKLFVYIIIFIFTYASLFLDVSNHFIGSVWYWFDLQFALFAPRYPHYYIYHPFPEITVISIKLLNNTEHCGGFSFVLGHSISQTKFTVYSFLFLFMLAFIVVS